MNNGEAPIEYIVQPGDTLFDICDQLMDEPHYWPKLWSHNPQIKNPHFIYPGNVLKFFTGEDGRPPYMEVVKEDDVLPVDRGDLNPEELVAQEVAIVDDQASFGDSMGPVITDEELDLGGTDQMFIESGGLYSDPSILLTVPGFIFAEKKEYSGEVIGHIEGHAMSGPDDPIIVKSLQGLNPGTVYSVIREGEYVYEPNTRDNIGYMYDFVGNIRINNKMNKDGYYTAVTIRDDMSSGIRNGDVLIPFRSTKRRIPDKNAYGREVTLNGATIIAYEWAKSVMGGEGNFVFINRGEGQLSEGDAVKLYSAYGHRASPAQKPQYPTVDVDKYNVAVARIIDVTDVAALGYIMNGEWETRLGDPAGN